MADDFVARARVSRGAWAPELRGRTAIVTGAGRLRSIGRAIALELARQGANIVLTGTGRDPATYPPEEQAIGWRDIDSVAEEVRAEGGQALPLVSDARDPAAVAALVESTLQRFGNIDILVNNAGAARGADRVPLVDLTLEDWSRVMDVNLTGAFLTSQAVAREMLKQGRGGSIINISSMASRLAAAGAGAYSASKVAINTLSRTLAVELAGAGVRVNAVLPGVIETSRMDDLGREARWENFVTTLTPLGFAGNGMEVAYLCVFLCSDMGAWITGQDIGVDGGGSWH